VSPQRVDLRALARRGARSLQRRIPGSVRDVLRGSSTLSRVRSWAFRGPRQHDELYGAAYFEMVERTTAQSAEAIADSIVSSLGPSSVVDVGCGTGTLLDRLRTLGVPGTGLEHASAALAECAARGLDVRRFDVETDAVPADVGPADVVASMEVGQQLRTESSGRYVDALCQIADVVVFSSGVPGQGDRAPRNEQPHQFWIDLFAARAYELDEALSMRWRREWQERDTAPWFAANVMVFRQRSHADEEPHP
jgi:SAM-dependent methyltransferase